jgi:hypothetical protein
MKVTSLNDNPDNELENLLKDGWNVDGYSVCMMAAGALAHNILLRKDYELRCITVISNQGKELGRNPGISFSPKPPTPVKKGFFG